MRLLNLTSAVCAATFGSFGLAAAQSSAYLKDIDVFFDYGFSQPYGKKAFWVTITGQDATAFRQGVLTYEEFGSELELDATLFPDRLIAQDHAADHIALTINVVGGDAHFQATPTEAKAAGTCKVRD